MIEKRFIYYKTRALFEADLNEGIIPLTSIVFITDPRAIYTHGTYWYCNSSGGTTPPTARKGSVFVGSGDAELTASAIKTLKEFSGRTSAYGSYSGVDLTEGKYIWFCIPSFMSLSGTFRQLGFEVAMSSSVLTLKTTVGGEEVSYKCYRSYSTTNAYTDVKFSIVKDD